MSPLCSHRGATVSSPFGWPASTNWCDCIKADNEESSKRIDLCVWCLLHLVCLFSWWANRYALLAQLFVLYSLPATRMNIHIYAPSYLCRRLSNYMARCTCAIYLEASALANLTPKASRSRKHRLDPLIHVPGWTLERKVVVNLLMIQNSKTDVRLQGV